jgi:hypothetical protein
MKARKTISLHTQILSCMPTTVLSHAYHYYYARAEGYLPLLR